MYQCKQQNQYIDINKIYLYGLRCGDHLGSVVRREGEATLICVGPARLAHCPS